MERDLERYGIGRWANRYTAEIYIPHGFGGMDSRYYRLAIPTGQVEDALNQINFSSNRIDVVKPTIDTFRAVARSKIGGMQMMMAR